MRLLLREIFARYNYMPTEYPGQVSKCEGKCCSFLFMSENFESLRYRKSRAHVQAFLFHSHEVCVFILDQEVDILIVTFLFTFVGYFPNKTCNAHTNVSGESE
jgi:hypothetical protein